MTCYLVLTDANTLTLVDANTLELSCEEAAEEEPRFAGTPHQKQYTPPAEVDDALARILADDEEVLLLCLA
jgi:hypothetical protein